MSLIINVHVWPKPTKYSFVKILNGLLAGPLSWLIPEFHNDEEGIQAWSIFPKDIELVAIT